VAEGVRAFRRLYADRVVRLEAGDQRLVVQGIGTYVDAVLRNILGNAHRFSPITEPIEVAIAREDGRAVVRIRDHGPGVGKDLLDEIYEPYVRTQPISDGTRGIGLGLVLCKRAMEAMGGSISARTLDGGGLEVCLGFAILDSGVDLDV
jgi:K+-sensing histidine kinase KdpD